MKKLAFLLLAGALSLQAADQTITFAVPEVDGTISLGVYDAGKRLVRTIATNATDKDPAFKIGLNGLITVWDGKNDAGEALPAGKYDVRGYVVPDAVKAEGEAFHFNDWVVDEDSPMLKSPRVVWAQGPEVILFGSGVFAKYTETEHLQALKEAPKNLQGTADMLDPKAAPSNIVVSDNKILHASEIANATAMEGSPESLILIDAYSPTIIYSDTKTVSGLSGAVGRMLPLGQEFKISSISLGVEQTVWMIGQPIVAGVPGTAIVLQHSFDGEVLRQLAGDFANTQIVADKTETRIYLTHTIEPATTVIKGMAPLTSDKKDASEPAATTTPVPATEPTETPKQADWEVFLEKTSTLCPKFGLVEGKLVADAGTTEQKTSYRFDLPPSTMDQQQHTLTVHLKAKDGEIWATGTGGLKLALVGKLPGVDRVVIAPGEKKGQLKVYAGNGVVVAEYLLSGLDEIAQINAGEIELP